jgi:hypothetical protein
MAVGVLIEVPGGTKEQYEQLSARAFPGGQLPAGWQQHLAGPFDGGWRVVNICDSEADFQQFAQNTLIPAAIEAGEAPPNISMFPIYMQVSRKAAGE